MKIELELTPDVEDYELEPLTAMYEIKELIARGKLDFEIYDIAQDLEVSVHVSMG